MFELRSHDGAEPRKSSVSWPVWIQRCRGCGPGRMMMSGGHTCGCQFGIAHGCKRASMLCRLLDVQRAQIAQVCYSNCYKHNVKIICPC